jgi:hypothetical protein
MIGAIARAHGDDPELTRQLQQYQRHALDDIACCGTAACGVHEAVCDHCGIVHTLPNTCGNRSCPQCQGAQRAAWVAAREEELLPGIGYFHGVFTLPVEISFLARHWPQVVLGALLKASADVVLTLCKDPRRLGAEVGIVSVLHTWTRDLRWHPHVHQIITAGGWDPVCQRWVDPRRFGPAGNAFLLPVPVVRAAYQKHLMALLLQAYEKGQFAQNPDTGYACLANHDAFRRHLAALNRKRWCIRIEPPFGSPDVLLRYLGAYINRVAISPKRILAHDPKANQGAGSVTWTWKSNQDPDTIHTRTQTGVDFLATFAQHILPPRLVRIRFRGLWSTAHRRAKLNPAHAWLSQHRPSSATQAPPSTQTPKPSPLQRCPTCGQGTLHPHLSGYCPRPRRAVRRRILADLRRQERTSTPPQENAIA